MKTIRTKLSMIFAMFMISLVLFGILLNAMFLERYYIYKNRNIFLEANKKISDEYFRNTKNFPEFLNQIDRLEGISSIIADSNMKVKYNSIPQKSDSDAIRISGDVEQLITKNEDNLLRTYVYSVVEKQNEQTPKLVFISRLESGELVILRKPLKGISESVSIANQFYVYAGLIIILFGGILIFTFAKKITSPVIQMSNVAESISNLDFNKRVVSDSQDELGSLGRSINKIAERLSASMNDLKYDVERRKQLVRNISHELKTPIGVIKGYAEGLKFRVAEDKEKTEKYCSVISEECDRIDRMVQELLNLSMLESGMFQLKISRFDIGGLIQNIVSRFEAVFIENGIKLDLYLQKDLFVSADYELLERIANNFITNAVHHAEGVKNIKVKADRRENGVRISVFNTGRNIPENDLTNIWDVFYKVDKARTRQYGGHGLGLSIVKQIAELHGGVVGAENVEEGVQFFVEIP